jgi:SAM-dependent methyltransferase
MIRLIARQLQAKCVVEFGCGDGALAATMYDLSYLGADISPDAIDMARRRIAAMPMPKPTADFLLLEHQSPEALAQQVCQKLGQKPDIVLSCDVIFHLVEDDVFDAYMARLLGCGAQYAVIYSTEGTRGGGSAHVRHRQYQPSLVNAGWEEITSEVMGQWAPAFDSRGDLKRFRIFTAPPPRFGP